MTPDPDHPPNLPRPVLAQPQFRHPGPARDRGWVLWWTLGITMAGVALVGGVKRYQEMQKEKLQQTAALLASAESLLQSNQLVEAQAAVDHARELLPDEARCGELMLRITTQKEATRQQNVAAAEATLTAAERLVKNDLAAAIKAFDNIRLNPSFPPEVKRKADERSHSLQGGVCSLRLPANWSRQAYLFIDDVDQNCDSSMIQGIVPGTHTLRFTRRGYRTPAAMTVEFRGLEPYALPAINWQLWGAKVYVTSKPAAAAIWRNGKNTGKVTPAMIEDVDNGPIEIVLKLPEFADTPVTGEVKDRKPLNLSATLPELPHLPVPGGVAGDRREINLTAKLRVAFRWCPAGNFQMGGRTPNQRPIRKVTLTKGFWLAETEFTQNQWYELTGEYAINRMQPNNKGNSVPETGPKLPMVLVRWDDICGDNSRQNGLLKRINSYFAAQKSPWVADLPTEAQWEYACRAGTSGDFGSRSPDPQVFEKLAWHDTNSDGGIHEVATKDGNPWGLHDMHGNVFEWCSDGFKPTYSESNLVDPTGAGQADWARSIRGGSSRSSVADCSAASRRGLDSFSSQPIVGFRLLLRQLALPPTQKPTPKTAHPPPKKSTPKPKRKK